MASKQFKPLPGKGRIRDLDLPAEIKDRLLDWGVQWVHVLVTIPVHMLQQHAHLANTEVHAIRMCLDPFGLRLEIGQHARKTPRVAKAKQLPSQSKFVPGTFADIVGGVADPAYFDQPDGDILGHA